MLRPLHWRENVRMKKQTSHKLSIKRWVILTLIFGFVATAGAVIIDIDYSMRQLKNETAAQYLSILNMQRESLDTDIGKASAILLSYKMSGNHINQLINCKDKNEAYLRSPTLHPIWKAKSSIRQFRRSYMHINSASTDLGSHSPPPVIFLPQKNLP